ncbi:MAG: pyridoxal phosphate-dependent decarboxylase family protein, partial [Acidimicrobiales bacterium]
MASFPYADEYEVRRALPDVGVDPGEILAMMDDLAQREDRSWESGQCSGTMYCGDRDHYALLNSAFAHFSHVNTLQRDMCPSATKFESEVIAMTLDLLGGAARPGAVGLITSGGSGSIAHAVLAYREHARERTSRPNIIKPETAHPAFAKACHLFGVDVKVAPIDPVTTRVDVD